MRILALAVALCFVGFGSVLCDAADLPIPGVEGEGNTQYLLCNVNAGPWVWANSGIGFYIPQHTTLLQLDNNQSLVNPSSSSVIQDTVYGAQANYSGPPAVGVYRSSHFLFPSTSCNQLTTDYYYPGNTIYTWGYSQNYSTNSLGWLGNSATYNPSGNAWFGTNLDSSNSGFSLTEILHSGSSPTEFGVTAYYGDVNGAEVLYSADVSQSGVREKLAETLISELSYLNSIDANYSPDFVMLDDLGDISVYEDFSTMVATLNEYTVKLHSIGVQSLGNVGVQFGLTSNFTSQSATEYPPINGWGVDLDNWVSMLEAADGFVIEHPFADVTDNDGVLRFFEYAWYAAIYDKSLILLATSDPDPNLPMDDDHFVAGAAMLCQALTGYGTERLYKGPAVSIPVHQEIGETSYHSDPDWNNWPTLYGHPTCYPYLLNEDHMVWAAMWTDGYENHWLFVDFAHYLAGWGDWDEDVPYDILVANGWE